MIDSDTQTRTVASIRDKCFSSFPNGDTEFTLLITALTTLPIDRLQSAFRYTRWTNNCHMSVNYSAVPKSCNPAQYKTGFRDLTTQTQQNNSHYTSITRPVCLLTPSSELLVESVSNSFDNWFVIKVSLLPTAPDWFCRALNLKTPCLLLHETSTAQQS